MNAPPGSEPPDGSEPQLAGLVVPGLDELLRRARAVADGKDDPEFEAMVLRGEMRCHRLNEELERAYGLTEGWDACDRARDERDYAHLVPIVQDIRSWGPKHKPYAERRAAELKWATPKPGDFTGKFTSEQYFGTPHLTVAERRAA